MDAQEPLPQPQSQQHQLPLALMEDVELNLVVLRAMPMEHTEDVVPNTGTLYTIFYSPIKQLKIPS